MAVLASLRGRHVDNLAGAALDDDVTVLPQGRALHGEGGRRTGITRGVENVLVLGIGYVSTCHMRQKPQLQQNLIPKSTTMAAMMAIAGTCPRDGPMLPFADSQPTRGRSQNGCRCGVRLFSRRAWTGKCLPRRQTLLRIRKRDTRVYCRSKRRCEPASEDKHEERRDNGLPGKKSAGWGLGRGGFNLCGGAGREKVAAAKIPRGGANPMFFSFPEIFIGPLCVAILLNARGPLPRAVRN